MVHGGHHAPLVGGGGVLFGSVLSHMTIESTHSINAVIQNCYADVTPGSVVHCNFLSYLLSKTMINWTKINLNDK